MITIIIKILNIFLEIIYVPFKALPVRNKITFISRQSDEESVDIAMLREALQKKAPNCEVVTLMHTIKPGIVNMILYCFHILKQMYHIATSRIVVLDSYCIVISLLHHKKSLTVVQMWHALGLMKKAGYSILGKPEGRSYSLARAMKQHKNYDVIFASSENCRKEMGEVFGYGEKSVHVCPLPRVDLLKSAEYIKETQSKIIKKYFQLKERKTVVYVPTFRKNESMMERQIEYMVSIFPYCEYNLIFNLHPLSKIKVEDKRVITKTPFSTMELLTVADYVISDYSSVIYEAAIMNKPLVFFAFDLENYQSERDFFIDYRKEVPGPICKNVEEVIDAIRSYRWDKEKLISFAEQYVEMKNSSCTDKMADYLKQIL